VSEKEGINLPEQGGTSVEANTYVYYVYTAGSPRVYKIWHKD
jgi:hypothetical protein